MGMGGCGFRLQPQARFLSPRAARGQHCWVGGLGGWVGGLGERVSGWMGVSGLLNIAERLSSEKRAADATGSRYNATYRYEQKAKQTLGTYPAFCGCSRLSDCFNRCIRRPYVCRIHYPSLPNSEANRLHRWPNSEACRIASAVSECHWVDGCCCQWPAGFTVC